MKTVKGRKQLFLRVTVWLIIVVLMGLSACKKKKVTNEKMTSYIEEHGNGLKKVAQIGDMKAVLMYKPWQLLKHHGETDEERRNKSNKFNFSNELFFVLSLSANNKELLMQLPFKKYSEMVQVLSFRMNEFIDILPDDKSPVEPLECIFQQTYGLGKANDLLIVFDRKKIIGSDNLKLRVKEFGLATGDLSFDIKTDDIRNIKNIALN